MEASKNERIRWNDLFTTEEERDTFFKVLEIKNCF